jgi:hypothetical protein
MPESMLFTRPSVSIPDIRPDTPLLLYAEFVYELDSDEICINLTSFYSATCRFIQEILFFCADIYIKALILIYISAYFF